MIAVCRDDMRLFCIFAMGNSARLKCDKMKKIKGFIRCFLWGFCPECNSDAPAIDNCPICKNHRAFDEQKVSTEILHATWWLNFLRKLTFDKNTKKYIKHMTNR